MSTIAELTADRTVEGVYAVARKQRRTTRKGAPYLLLELVDQTGRIEARIWKDVELLDGRFAEGDAVRVLGRVESFDNRLQLEIRSVEAADDDPAGLAPRMRRDADELDGFLEFLAAELSHAGLVAVVGRFLGDDEIRKALRELPAAETHHSYAGGLLEHTVGVATLVRETAQLHPRLRSDLLLAAALLHDVGRVRELGRGPSFRPTEEGRLLAMCISACGSSRSGPRRSTRTCAPSCCTRSPATTTGTLRARPRRPFSTTPTSSTPSRRPDQSASARDRAGTRREPLVGARRLRRRPEVEDAARPDGAGAVAGRRDCGSAGVGRGIGRQLPQLVRDVAGRCRGGMRLCGIGTLYRGMAIGAMGIVAPVSAVAAVIPFSVGIASGERPSALQVVGILLALAGVAVASREPAEGGSRRASGIGLALVAALAFGLYFVFADRAADESVPYAVATARGVSLLLALVAALVVGASLRPGRVHWPALAVVGLCDVGANMLFSLATTRGYLSVVSVLAALYPIVTVVLAAVVLHERVSSTQRLGVAAALAGAALITAG